MKYGRDPDSGDWLLEKAEELTVKYKYGQAETKTFETLLVNKSDARELAYELLDAYKNPIKEIEVLVKLQASKLKVGDKIKITRSRAPGSDGSWSAETFQIKTITKEGGYRTRLLLEPNKYLSASTVSTDEKMEHDDKEAITKATSLITSDFQIKADKKVEGKTPTIGTTTDKTEGAIEDTTHLIKTDKVIATSIKLDEALRKDSITLITVPSDGIRAVPHNQTTNVNYVIGMYSTGDSVLYEIKGFNWLSPFNTSWYIVTFSTGDMPNLVLNGDMETGSPPSNWTAVNGAILAAVGSPVHGGSQALKVTIAAGQTWGAAEQEITVEPGPDIYTPAGVYDARGWLRNGDADNCQLPLW
ncbi:MAG: hypothetical protein HWN68_20900, partial [Desulfobacterales bacterium]|nr:hypothetical protein [Desulfobacterales bacterium]